MLRVLFALLLMTGVGRAEWDKDIPLSSDNLTDFPTDNQANLDALEDLFNLYPKGITLSYSSASTIVASTGGVVCSNSGATIRRLRGNTSTTNVTFSDLDTGAESSGTYYIYATCDAVATTAAFKISSSSSAPSGITYYKRIGSFVNDGSNNITASSITNDAVYSGSLLGDWSSKSIGTTYQALTDGIVTAFTTSPISGNNNGVLKGLIVYSDSSSSPTTIRAQSGTTSSTTAIYAYVSSPVKKGDYYQVSNTSSSGATMYFIPMGG